MLGAMQPEQAPLENRGHSDAEWQKLKGLLKQRDDEISIHHTKGYVSHGTTPPLHVVLTLYNVCISIQLCVCALRAR